MRRTRATALLGLLAIIASLSGPISPAAAGGETDAELPDFSELWDFQDPAATERRFRELLPAAAEATAAGDPDYGLQLRTQIARTLGLQRKFDAAHALLDSILLELAPAAVASDGEAALIAAAGAPAPGRRATPHVRYLLERGRLLNSSGHPKESRPLFRAALDIAAAHAEDCLGIDAAHMLGIVMPLEEQLSWNERAIELAEQTAEPCGLRWLGPLYHNTGMTYLDQGEFPRALAIFEKAWVHRQLLGDALTTRIAKWAVAHTLRRMGRLNGALALQREIEAECDAAGEPDGYVFEEIAEILLAQDRAEDARPYFTKAFELLREDPWLKESEPERIVRLGRLSRVE